MKYTLIKTTDNKQFSLEIENEKYLYVDKYDKEELPIFGYVRVNELARCVDGVVNSTSFANLIIGKTKSVSKYVCVVDENGNEGYIGVCKKRFNLFSLVLIFFILALGSICIVNGEEITGFIKDVTVAIVEKQVSYEDGVLFLGNWSISKDGVIYQEMPLRELDEENENDDDMFNALNQSDERIYANLYADSVLSVNNTLPLTNPSGNTVDFVYTIVMGNEEIYKTQKINPGRQVEWKASDYLKKGAHNIVIYIDVYDTVTNVEYQGFYFPIEITIL